LNEYKSLNINKLKTNKMNFDKAVEIVEKNKNLVGQKYRGGIIDEIIIYPTNPEMRKKYDIEYVTSLNVQVSIVPYMGLDVDIAVVVDKWRIRKERCLPLISLYDLREEFDIIGLE
jgi:hypothetical protein